MTPDTPKKSENQIVDLHETLKTVTNYKNQIVDFHETRDSSVVSQFGFSRSVQMIDRLFKLRQVFEKFLSQVEAHRASLRGAVGTGAVFE